MSTSRRKFLALVGGGIVLAAGAGAAGFAMTRTPGKALAPWDAAGSHDDPRLRALSYALLAPNPHNRQPWLAELVGSDGVTLWRDPARNLPVTDPHDRQLTIGMGCFLELMRIAAAEEGIDIETTLFPNGDAGPVAVCRFRDGAASPDPLFAHVLARRSHKAPFDPGRTIPPEQLAALASHATIVTSEPELEVLKRNAVGAWETEMTTRDPYMESVHLFRVGKREINANPDGIDIGDPMLDALRLAGQLPDETLADMSHPAVIANMKETSDQINAASAIALVTTPANTRTDQMRAGADWLRLNLAATGMGVALRPVSQALQEYAEVRDYYDAVQNEFAPTGGTVQMLGLLGYGTPTSRTPRWPIESRMVNA